MLPRPSSKEIHGKVILALELLRSGRWQIGLTKHLTGDLAELELDATQDLPDLLIVLLEEIKAAGPVNCYAGTRPPQRSYEREIRDLELWAYHWQSRQLQKRMYIKFAIKKQCYIYVDCHEDRPQQRLL
jgi:hypothetical protein